MTASFTPAPGAVTVVLVDANVLYSRVLRDYVLYSAAEQLISVRWSQRILQEFAEHLVANVEGFDPSQAARLFEGMNAAHPYALVEPSPVHFHQVDELTMPDPDDRHVLAASVAAEAGILCTSNTRDFPSPAMSRVGIQRYTPDELLHGLVLAYPSEIRQVHETTVTGFEAATHGSTIEALKRAGAVRTAEQVSQLFASCDDR